LGKFRLKRFSRVTNPYDKKAAGSTLAAFLLPVCTNRQADCDTYRKRLSLGDRNVLKIKDYGLGKGGGVLAVFCPKRRKANLCMQRRPPNFVPHLSF
jgi:hypothetical protein